MADKPRKLIKTPRVVDRLRNVQCSAIVSVEPGRIVAVLGEKDRAEIVLDPRYATLAVVNYPGYTIGLETAPPYTESEILVPQWVYAYNLRMASGVLWTCDHGSASFADLDVYTARINRYFPGAVVKLIPGAAIAVDTITREGV